MGAYTRQSCPGSGAKIDGEAMMEARLILCLAILFLTAFSASIRADSGEVSESAAIVETELVEPPSIDFRIIDQGGMRTVISNWGFIGNYQRRPLDPETGETALPLEYPSGSRIKYLYHAGLWIGGIVGEDTLVSTGTLSSWARHELYPDTGESGLLGFDDLLSDEAYAATVADTFPDPNITVPDRIDGLHRPLQVSLHQEYRAWADTNFRNLLWIQLTVTNIGPETIEDAYIGWQTDPDVHHVDTLTGYNDDLVGYRQGNASFDGRSYPYEAVYTIDNDGDPDLPAGFVDSSPTGALGLAFISGNSDPAVRSFNWWITSYSLDLDWGPHYPSPDPSLPDLIGRPVGDVARYRMMANGEIDYDQVFAGVDRSADGWVPPPDTTPFAAGFDIRFLYSVGPYTITPGQSIELNFVWFVAEGVHTDPEHFANTFSFDNPDLYLAGLDFSLWETTLGAAFDLNRTSFASAAPGPPPDIGVHSWTTSEAVLSWRRKGTFDLAGYEIFRKNQEGEYPEFPLATVSADDSVFADAGLERKKHHYAIRSFDVGGRRGPLSADIEADLQIPMAVELLEPLPEDGAIALSWNPSVYPDVSLYHIHRYEETMQGETTAVLIGLIGLPYFTDMTLAEATVYEYSVTAATTTGILGPPSNRVQGMVMAFNGGPLIIDQTLADPSGLTEKDSVGIVWQRILPEATYRDEDRALPPAMTLYDFNQHPVTIVLSSGNFSETEHIRELLRHYFIAGGSVLFVGRDLFNTTDLAYGNRFFGPGDFEYDYFGITRTYYPPTLLAHPTRMNAEFIAARACSPGLSDLAVDSLRTGWGIAEQLQPVGPGIPFVGWIEGDPVLTECLFTYESLYPDTSFSQGKTVGLFFYNGRHRTATLNFPLAMMQEEQAEQALRAVLAKLGDGAGRPGDFDGNGRIDVIDAVLMISFLFRNGDPPPDPINADLNNDCKVNLLDVVILINYLFRGGTAPVAGCVP